MIRTLFGKVRSGSSFILILACLIIAGGASPASGQETLFAGGQSPGMVYQYEGGGLWTPVSGILGIAILDLICWEGTLYAATQNAYWFDEVWKYENGIWESIGTFEDDYAVYVLEVLDGELYCGTASPGWDEGRLYRYVGGMSWTLVASTLDDPNGLWWHGFRSSIVSDITGKPEIHLGDLNANIFGTYHPSEGFEHHEYFNGSCVWDYAELNGELWAGAWHGALYRTADGEDWEIAWNEPSSRNLWAVEAYNGFLYIGGDSAFDYPLEGVLYRREADGSYTEVWTIPVNSSFGGVISLLTDGSVLYIGTGVSHGYYSGDDRAEAYVYDEEEVK